MKKLELNNTKIQKIATGMLAILAILLTLFVLIESFHETYFLKSDASRFDAFAALPEVESHVGEGAKLASVYVDFVRADGTLDLYAKYEPRATYIFYREVSGEKDLPTGANGVNANGKILEGVTAEVYRPFKWQCETAAGSSACYYFNKGLDIHRFVATSAPTTYVENPKCKIYDLWQQAIVKGVPNDAVAKISYNASGYDFAIEGTDVKLHFGSDCNLEN